jgi:fatty-acyl-CoA synthase
MSYAVETPGATTWSALEDAASRAPNAAALILVDDEGRESLVSYSELHRDALDLAGRLHRAGVAPGDHVGLWMTNRVEWVLVAYAVARLGAVLIPISTWLRPTEVAHLLRHAQLKHLIALDRFRKLDTVAVLNEIDSAWDPAPGPVSSASFPDLRTYIVVNRNDPRPPVGRFGLPASDSPLPTAPRADDVASILYTSGSTGRPKGVVLDHGPLVENARQHGARLGITGKDVWCSPLPFFHVGGCVWGMLTTVVAAATLCSTEAFDAARTVDLLARHRATVLFGVRPVIQDVLEVLAETPLTLPSVRIVSAREPAIAAEVRERFSGLEMTLNPFGMTETYGPVAMSSRTASPDEQLSSGTPLPGYEIRIAIPGSDQPVTPGEVGELLVRGLTTRGYLGEEIVPPSCRGQAWLRTGDLARLDERGGLRHVGRLKAMLKVGGENVAVEEVEGCLMEHPAVHAAAVLGRPDTRLEEVPVACVSLSDATDPDQLRRWCADRLAAYKVPVEVLVIDHLPMTATAKVDREALRNLVLSS